MDIFRLVEGIAAGSAVVASFVSWRRTRRSDAGKARAQSNRDLADAKHANSEERSVGIAELEAAVKAQGTVIDRQSSVIDDLGRQVAHLEGEVEKCRVREQATDRRIAELEALVK